MYSSDQLYQIAALFALSPDGFEEIRVGSRWMGRRYVVITRTGRFFLKVRSEWWPAQQAETVCSVLQSLAQQGFPVPLLRPAAGGTPFAVWDGHICECHRFVEGRPVAADDVDQVRQSGSVLALLHSMLAPLTLDNGVLPEGCGFPHQHHVAFFAERVRPVVSAHPGPSRLLDQLLCDLSALQAAPPTLRVSASHGDYHPGNLIYGDRRIRAVCDFDLTQSVPVAWDLGYFLYRTAGRPSQSEGGCARIDRRTAGAFMDGYTRQGTGHPVSAADIAREIRRFALYDCLLQANNMRDATVFEAWALDALHLGEDLDRGTANGV